MKFTLKGAIKKIKKTIGITTSKPKAKKSLGNSSIKHRGKKNGGFMSFLNDIFDAPYKLAKQRKKHSEEDYQNYISEHPDMDYIHGGEDLSTGCFLDLAVLICIITPFVLLLDYLVKDSFFSGFINVITGCDLIIFGGAILTIMFIYYDALTVKGNKFIAWIFQIIPLAYFALIVYIMYKFNLKL